MNGAVRGPGDGALRISARYGYVEVGPRNTAWCHFYTDRGRFHFNKGILVGSGQVSSYNEDLQLQTTGSTRIAVLNATGYVGVGTTSPAEQLHVNGSVRGDQNGALRISTGFGYVDVGPRDTTWCHFLTDRSGYLLDKELRVDSGLIGSYNEDCVKVVRRVAERQTLSPVSAGCRCRCTR